MKKIDLSRLRIKTRRDWVIFWIFAGLLCYGAADVYKGRINDWLREIGEPWLSNLNEPQAYGRLIAAAVLFALVAEVVLWLCRKPARVKLAVLAAGILAVPVFVGLYRANCKLIVSRLWQEEPSWITAEYKEDGRRMLISLTSEDERGLLELVRNLTIMSDAEQKESFLDWYREDGRNSFMDADQITLRFSEKYGHGYDLWLRCDEGYVYLWRGYGRGQDALITLFEDNGLTQWLEERKE